MSQVRVQDEPKSNWKSVFLIALVLFALTYFSRGVIAAPHPGTATSKLISPHIGLYLSSKGYSIHADQTTWVQTEPPATSPFIETMYRPLDDKGGIDAALTVRVDRLEYKVSSLNEYMKRWLKDYPKYGFTILSARPIQVKQNSAYMVDMVNQQTGKQLRQVIFMNGVFAAILTCRDDRSSFLNTLKSCNQIVRNFSWTILPSTETTKAKANR